MAVDLSPLVPVVGPLLLAGVTAAAPFLLHKLYALLHIKVTQAQEDRLNTLVQAGANNVYAKLASQGASLNSVAIKNQYVAEAAEGIVRDAPALIKALDITPASVTDKVHAAFGGALVQDQQVTLAPASKTSA